MSCPFCHPDKERVFFDDPYVFGLWDGFPVTEGHALIIPKRHFASWFEASRGEQSALLEGIKAAKREIEWSHAPGGYNIGINVGEAAGQTVPHLHVHVIPRYRGDVPDPRGGVRYVIPDKANYLVARDAAPIVGTVTDVLGGEGKPLLPALARELGEATGMDAAVAFVTSAGLDRIQQHLIDLLERGGQVRFLTGDYLDVSEPRALRRLLDLAAEYAERFELRIFECVAEIGFHPKAYILHRGYGSAAAFVGSSNLTRHALERGIEWNQHLHGSVHRSPISVMIDEFDRLFRHSQSLGLTADWIRDYERRRVSGALAPEAGLSPEAEPSSPLPTPHGVQEEALDALRHTRADGNQAGLVVMATGLGKTWLAAFDSEGFERVLFVAHREEILKQAMQTFRRIRPDADLGMYIGGRFDRDADVLFASVQTLSRRNHLESFQPEQFDYIVVDEFHHAAARTYRRLIDYFSPRFLLGLTATPERSDGGDLLALCGENLVFRCDLADGIRRELLSPFHYFGIADSTDFSNIPWRNGRFDPESLDNALATEKRADLAWTHWQAHRQPRTLAFCVSKTHADYMGRHFSDRGARVAVVHSGEGSSPRTLSLERLERGELDVVFSVDMFNEGVDVPAVDTILMLRPTDSRIVWLQQFGRGLRRAVDKSHLSVIDFIGNHRTFLKVPMLLLPGAERSQGDLRMALEALERAELELPPGCFVEYDLEAINLLKQLSRPTSASNQLELWYRSFREMNDRRPFAAEAYHEGYDPKSVRRTYGSWLGFVKAQGDVEDGAEALFEQHRQLFAGLETTAMTKSFKIVTLLAMISRERFPGSIDIDELMDAILRQVNRIALLNDEFAEHLQDRQSLREMLELNPINAWCGEGALGGEIAFAYEAGQFRTTVDVPANYAETFREWAREICDWRLAQYLERLQGETRFAKMIVCKVSQSNGRPILFLPDRKTNPGIPEGDHPLLVGDEEYQAKFVKIAINVINAAGQAGENRLPELLRAFFGPEAGKPGRNDRVKLQLDGHRYRLEPLVPDASQRELWREYMRAEIPPLWGLEFSTARWNQGFLIEGGHMFLLVTLAKDDMMSEHQYEDSFVERDQLVWISQNRTRRETPTGQKIKMHRAEGIDVHLFVRDRKKTSGGRPAAFVYCGELDFLDWDGDQPINVNWRLTTPLPDALFERFTR